MKTSLVLAGILAGVTLASASANSARPNGGPSSGAVLMAPAAIRSAAAPKLFSTAIDPSTVISSL